MSEPDAAAILNKIKIPSSMKAAQQLRDYLINYAQSGQTQADPQNVQRVLTLLTVSHLELVGVLGQLEESSRR